MFTFFKHNKTLFVHVDKKKTKWEIVQRFEVGDDDDDDDEKKNSEKPS